MTLTKLERTAGLLALFAFLLSMAACSDLLSPGDDSDSDTEAAAAEG